MDFDFTKRVLAALEAHRVRYAVFGAVALNLHGLARFTSEDLLGDYPAVQYNPPDATFHIDILTRLGSTYTFADLKIERVAFDDILVSVVTPRTLDEMAIPRCTARFGRSGPSVSARPLGAIVLVSTDSVRSRRCPLRRTSGSERPRCVHASGNSSAGAWA